MNKKTITLKRSLTLVIALTSCIALLQAYLAFVVYDQHTYRLNHIQQLRTLLEVTAGNSKGALFFLDEEAAEDVLDLLRVYPHIRRAAMLDVHQQVFAEYRNNWQQGQGQLQVIGEGLADRGEYLELSHPIVHDGEIIGHIYLLADLDEAKMRFRRFTLIGGTVMLVALVASLIFSRRLIPFISRPILSLVSLTDSVSRKKDYSRQVAPTSIAELKNLNQGIVSMLRSIDEREQELRHSEQRLSLALKGSGEGMWDWNIPARSTYFDKSCCEVLGFEELEVEMLDRIWSSRIHPDDVALAKRAFINALKGDTDTCDVEYRVEGEQGGWTWLHLRGSVVTWDQRGRPLRMTGTMADITERKRIEEEVRLYATVFNNTHDAVVILDGDFSVLAVNKAFSDISGYSVADMLGSSNRFLQSDKNPIDFYHWLKKRIEVEGEWQGETWDKKKNGESYPQELALKGIADQDGHYVRYVAVFSDITERKKTEEELRFMANYDSLTELPNRGMFQGSLTRSIRNAKRHDEKLALLFVDLDKFKQVNDMLGHDGGDNLLKQVAKRLRRTVRDSDIVARLAGDEFTVVLENIKSDRDAEVVARKVLLAFEEGFMVKGYDTGVGASIGIAVFPHDASEAEPLMQCADTAMYYAKSLGHNNFKFYNTGMNVAADERSQLESDLRQAFKQQVLEVYFQPKIDVQSLRVVGFETLLRWRHPHHGWVSPALFIPVAENSGLINPIGEWVLRQACRELKRLQALGHHNLHMAVNVSPKQFQIDDFPLQVANVLAQEKVNPGDIELELTESLIMDTPDKVILMLRVLKNIGVKLSVDDFGTGYSSLSYLHQFPIDTLKIDQTFVREIDEREDGIAIAAAIVSMAHNLKLTVVAEGVETATQFDRLKGLSCEMIQGYYFSKPVPVEAIEQLLEHSFSEAWLD